MHGKSMDHLSLHCLVAYDLWSLVLSDFWVHWVMLSKVIDSLARKGCMEGIITVPSDLQLVIVLCG